MAFYPHYVKYKFHENVEPDYQVDYDSNGNVIYEGLAEPSGTGVLANVNQALWTIKKNTYNINGQFLYSRVVENAIWSQRSIYFNS